MFKLPKLKLDEAKGAALTILNSVKKSSPEILIGIGLVGFASTVVLAVKATPKALELIEERKDELDVDELPPLEMVKTAGPCYGKAAAVGVLSALCFIESGRENFTIKAGLATLTSLQGRELKDLKEKTAEIVGDKKAKEIQDAVATEQVRRTPITNKEVIVTGKGEQLCFDPASGRYFKGDIESLRRIENSLNRRMARDMEPYISLNDYYYEVGLPQIDIGDDLGWNMSDGAIEFEFSTTLAEDGRPCLVVGFRIAPRYDFCTLH